MKKLLYLFIVIAFVTSCKKEMVKEGGISKSIAELKFNSTNTLTKQQFEKKNNYIKSFKHVGEKHNSNLAAVLCLLKKDKLHISSKKDHVDHVKSIMDQVLGIKKNETKINQSSLKQAGFLNKTTSVPEIGFDIETLNSFYYAQFDPGTEQFNYTITHDPQNSGSLTYLLDKLILLSDNNELSWALFSFKLNELNDEAISILTEEKELTIYFCSSSVSASTFQYWENNLDQWVALYENNLTPNTVLNHSMKSSLESPWNHWGLKGLRGADVGGAAGGALLGFIGGSFAGGVGGPPGAAIGALAGSTCNSTAKLVENMYNHFFP